MEKLTVQPVFVYAKIRNRRIELNYKQEYVADKLNISQNAYSKLERGIHDVNIRRLCLLAHILDMNIVQFFE